MPQLITFALGSLTVIVLLFAWRYGRRLYLKNRQKARKKKALSRLTIEQKERYGVVELWEDTSGRTWLAFENSTRMPAARSIYVEIATRQTELNLTTERFLEFVAAIEFQMNKGQFVKAAELLGEMKDRSTWACEEETLLTLASYYFLLEGEDPVNVSDDWTKKKREIFKTEPEVRAFFLIASYRLIKQLSDITESDILAYLAEHQVKKHLRQRGESTPS